MKNTLSEWLFFSASANFEENILSNTLVNHKYGKSNLYFEKLSNKLIQSIRRGKNIKSFQTEPKLQYELKL